MAKTKKQIMDEKIFKHGMDLYRIFPNAILGPLDAKALVTLCKALRRLESRIHRIAEDYCNTGSVDIEKAETNALKALKRILGETEVRLHINFDPRGYALKIDDQYMRDHKLDLHRDWGGYGILAPDLNQ